MHTCNIILTGIPRSGTTLTCHLLNKLPNTVALHEPIRGLSLHPKTASREIGRYFKATRRVIRINKTAVSRHVGGQVPDNHVGGAQVNSGIRQSMAAFGEIRIDKALSPDFLLIIKHPALFTALLERLIQRFPCYAVIRNPLSVLASWNSLSFHVQEGHAPMAERFDNRLARRLAGLSDKTDRQLCLLSWFYDQYRKFLPDRAIIRYEELVASGGRALRVISPEATRLNEALESKNINPLYNRDAMGALGERLLKTRGAFWHFYSRQSVEQVLAEVASRNDSSWQAVEPSAQTIS